MRKRSVIFCILIFLTPLSSGCWFFVGGATGYEVSSDSVRGHFDTSLDNAYQVSLKVMRSKGNTTMEDKKGGWIKAEIEGYNVAAHIEKLTPKTVRITISARKYALPKAQFARDILDKISEKLK